MWLRAMIAASVEQEILFGRFEFFERERGERERMRMRMRMDIRERIIKKTIKRKREKMRERESERERMKRKKKEKNRSNLPFVSPAAAINPSLRTARETTFEERRTEILGSRPTIELSGSERSGS